MELPHCRKRGQTPSATVARAVPRQRPVEEEPFRPEVILWCEAPEGLIVRSDVVDPHATAQRFDFSRTRRDLGLPP
jgi:hypothetical protein